jgi:hypothetical protein
MKTCPVCQRLYSDEEMIFCLADGTQLLERQTQRRSGRDVAIIASDRTCSDSTCSHDACATDR